MQHEIRNSRYWLDAGSRKMVSVQLHEEGAPPNQSEKKGFPLKMRLDLGLPIGASQDVRQPTLIKRRTCRGDSRCLIFFIDRSVAKRFLPPLLN